MSPALSSFVHHKMAESGQKASDKTTIGDFSPSLAKYPQRKPPKMNARLIFYLYIFQIVKGIFRVFTPENSKKRVAVKLPPHSKGYMCSSKTVSR